MAVMGISEVKASLRAVVSGGKNATRTAAYAGARFLRDEERKAERTFFRGSGLGARHIIAKRGRSTASESTATVEVTRAGFYLHILEVGTKRHPIVVQSVHSVIDPRTRKTIGKDPGRKALTIKLGGHVVAIRRVVPSTGFSAKRWFSSTAEQKKSAVLEIVKQQYLENLETQAQKKGL